MTTREPRLIGTLRRDRAALLRGTALQAAVLAVFALPALTQTAAAQPAPNARPTGGTVVGGGVTINQSSATNTQVTQTTPRGAVDWRSFDVGASQSVTFAQPSASAITLNRVTASNPSQIAGQITANGQIVIVNQSGVVFFPGSQVNAQSLVVSAAGIDPKNFMAGTMVFDQAPKPGARIVNQGTLTAGKAGLVGLVAPSVANSGVITARMGHVVLAGAEAATLDLYGDGLISLDVTKQVTTLPMGPDGKPVTALVTNTGLIRADGGTVQLTAAAADGLVQTLVTAGGTISARTVGGSTGGGSTGGGSTGGGSTGGISIAGTGGSVIVDGALLANGARPGQTGGRIAVNATGDVTVASGARIAANGRAGGGTIAIGTTLARAAGGASVNGAATARHTTVQSGATISANATAKGAGGTIAVLGTDLATMQGLITAKGGPQGGDGGAVEISGNAIQLGGSVDVSAPRGALGTILLDPEDLTISNGTPTLTPGGTDPNISYGQNGTIGGDDFFVTPASLQALNGNVHLQAARTLTVASSFTVTGGVTLESGNNLFVNAGQTISSGGGITLSAGVNFNGSGTVAGYNSGASLSLLGGLTATDGISLAAPTGGIALGAGTVSGGSLSIVTTGALTQSASGVLVGTSASSAITAASISLPGPNNLGTLFSAAATNGGALIATAPGKSLTIFEYATVSAGQTLTLIADTLNFGGANLQAQGGNVVLAPASSGYGIEVIASGDPASGVLSLNDAQLVQSVQARNLILGTAANPVASIKLGNAGDSIDLRSIVTGGTTTVGLGLYTSGAVTQLGSLFVGSIFGSVGTLTLANITASGTNLLGNQIGAIGSLTSSSDIGIVNNQSLVAAGPVTATGTVNLTSYGTLNLTGSVSAATVNLIANGSPNGNGGLATADIVEQGGSITAALLTANATLGSISLSGENQIVALGTIFSAASTSVGGYLNNVGTLTFTGAATTLGASTTLNVGGDLIVNSPLNVAANGALTLDAVGNVNEVTGGVIAVSNLYVNANSISLAQANNIGTLQDVEANGTAGNVSIANAPGNGLTINYVSVSEGQTITLAADSINFGDGSTVSAPFGTVNLTPASANYPVEIIASGTPSANTLSIDYNGLLNILSGTTLQIGTPQHLAGAIKIGNAADTIDFSNYYYGFESRGPLSLGLFSTAAATVNGLLYTGEVHGQVASLNAGFLTNGSSISTIGSLTATGDILVRSYATTTVAGPVSGNNVEIETAATPLILTGNVTGQFVLLNADFTGGSVTQTGGIITAGTLNALGGDTATGSISLTGNNQITSLAQNFQANGGTAYLNNARSLAVSDTTLGANTTLNVAGGITVTGVANGGSASFLSLLATGAITQTGTGALVAGSLSASGTSVSLTSAQNQVTTISSGTATAGGFAFTDSTSLTVGGTITATGANTIAITADVLTLANGSGALVVPGGTVALAPLTNGAAYSVFSAGAIVAPNSGFSVGNQGSLISATVLQLGSPTTGQISIGPDGNAVAFTNIGTLALVSGAGIVQDAALSAPTLTGSSGNSVVLTSANTITTLGSFASTSGFYLDNSTSLTVVGPVTDHAFMSIVALGTLFIAGNVSAPAVSLAANPRVLNSVTFGNGDIVLSSGNVNGGQLGFTATGNIVQTGGSITAGGYLDTSSGGYTSLPGTANAVANLGSVTAVGGFTLVTGGLPLIIAGPVVDTDPVAMPSNFALTSSGGGGATPVSSGAASSAVSVTSTNNDITLTGLVSGPSISLVAAGTISQSGGSLVTTGALTGSGTSVNLIQATNSVAQLGGFTATGSFLLADSVPLSVIGAVSVGGATPPFTLTLLDNSPSLAAGGSLSAGGTGTVVLAPLTSGAALNLGAGSGIGGAPLITAGTLVVGSTTAGAVTIGGTLNLASVPTLDLISASAITEASGAGISVNALIGSGGTITLTGTNSIATLGSVTAPGGVTITDGSALTVTGPVNGGTGLYLNTNGSLTLAGVLNTTGTADLIASGAITQVSGSLAAATLLASSASGAVSFTSPTNAVGTLSTSSATSLTLVDGTSLTVSGFIDAPVTNLSVTGPLTFSGALYAGTSLTLASTGAITETAGSSLQTALLQGNAASASLQTTNYVTTLGSFSTQSGFVLATGSLTVAGPVSDLTMVAITTRGSLTLSGNITAPTVALTATSVSDGTTIYERGDLLQTSGIVSAANTLSLVAAGLISQTGGALSAGTLTGSASLTVSATGTANLIGTLGSFSSAGGFALTNGASLIVAGPVTDTASITLATTTGGLNFAGVVNAPTIALASAGAITQTSGSLTATLLTGSGAGVALSSATNAITTLGGFASSGNFTLADTGTLTVAGTVSVATGATLTLANDTPAFAAAALLSAPGGTVVLEPLTSGDAITLGGGGGLAGTSQVTANTLVIGNTAAGPITIAGSFNLANVPTLDLVSGGLVSETAAGSVAVNTLIGNATGGVSLVNANQIATLGAIASGGTIQVADTTAVTVAGTLTAPGQQIVLRDDSITFGTGALLTVGTSGASASSGVYLLPYATGDSLVLAGGAGATGPAVTATNLLIIGSAVNSTTGSLVTAGSLQIAGALNFGTAASAIVSSSGPITETGTGAIGLGTLNVYQGTAVSLTGANAVGTLAIVSTSGGFALTNARALTVAGPVSDAIDVTLTTGGGGIALGGVVSAPTITLVSAGAITQNGGTLAANLLTGSGAGVTLGQTANTVASLGGFTSTGAFLLADASALTISGAVSAAAGATLTIQANAPTFGAGGSLSAGATGTVVLAPLTSGAALALGGGTGIGASPAVTAGTLVVGGTTAGPVTFKGGFNLAGAGTLDVLSGSSITEASGAAISVGALEGGGTSIVFGGANTIATLGAIAAPNGLTLVDASSLTVNGPVSAASGLSLNVTGSLLLAGALTTSGTASLIATGAIVQTAGSLTAGTLTNSASSTSLSSVTNAVGTLGTSTDKTSLALVDNIGLLVAGTVDPATVSLTVNGPLTIAAPIVATNNIALIATGAITEIAGGGLNAPVLRGSGASASLAQGGNTIATLGSFSTTSGFTLADSSALNVAGPVSDGTSVALTTLGSLQLGGTITAPSLSLTSGGAIVQTGGALLDTTLSGGAGQTVNLSGTANLIGALASFSSTGGFALSDTQALTVAGPLNDTASIALTTSGGLTLAGAVTAPSVVLNAGGTINQIGGTLSVTTSLSGSGAGVTLGQASNTVATLGGFASSGDFLFADATPLTVAGRVSVGAGHTIALANDSLSLGASASLVAPGGTIVLEPLTAGDAMMLGGGGGLAGTSQVSANTLVIGNVAAGSITIAGAFNVTGAATLGLVSGGEVFETGSGALAVGTLIGSASGGFILGGANQIGTLGNISSVSYVTNIFDAIPVTIGGTVSAQGQQIEIAADSITFGAGGLLTVGTSTALTGTNTNLQGNQAQIFLVPYVTGDPLVVSGGAGTAGAAVTSANIVKIGRRQDLGTGSLIVSGSLSIAGSLNFGATTVILSSTGNIAEASGGALATGTLSVDPTVTQGGSATLTGPNVIAALGTVATNGGFVLVDATGLTVTGPVTDSVAVGIQAAGPINLSGTVSAPQIALASDNVVFGPGALLSAPGGLVAVLPGTTGDAITLNGPTAFTPGSFVNASLMTVGQTSTGGIQIDGALNFSGATTLQLTAGGNISESQALVEGSGAASQGALAANVLTGSAASVSLGGANAIATLGGFTAGCLNVTCGFVLNDSVPLAIAGPLSANGIVIAAPGSITLGATTVSAATVNIDVLGRNGVATPTLTQLGTTTFKPIGVGNPSLTLQVPSGGAIQLGNLQAPAYPVTLITNTGGVASGTLNVAALTVIGSGGAASLFGSVGGQGGFPAAIASRISPDFNTQYLLNGCPIMSVSCTTTVNTPLLPRTGLASTIFSQTALNAAENAAAASLHAYLLTLDLFTLSLAPDPQDPDELLPNISRRDN
jgi:filamentous hemagglutinin family protein